MVMQCEKPVSMLCSSIDSDEDASERSQMDEDHRRTASEELTDVHFKFEVKAVQKTYG